MRLLRWCLALFLVAIISCARADDSVVSVDGFIDTEACYDALIVADEDFDRRVTADEYVTVVQLLGPDGFMANVTDFADLPFLIRATFLGLACLCTSAGGASDCCVGDNAHISNLGAAPDETPTEEQSAYLFTACLATERSIDAVQETTAPTTYPSAMPSLATPAPTAAPSLSPSTLAPSTIAPSGPPSTTVPTTMAPTLGPSVPLQFNYVVQVDNGKNQAITDQEIQDLEDAMDSLAVEVADETFNSPTRNLRRRLAVTVDTPTQVVGSITAVCPDNAPAEDDCRDVAHSVTLLLDDEDPAVVEVAYTDAMNQAIADGRLQDKLPSDSRLLIQSPTGASPTPSPAAAASSGLSTGATAGIAIAAVVTVLAAAGLLVARKKRTEKDDVYYAAGSRALADSDQNARDAAELETDSAMLGASQADYGKKSKQAVQTSVVAFDTLEDADAKAAAAGKAEESGGEESASAGSSGWSSSAGVSSLNTGSADSLDFPGAAAAGGATLAAIGAASAITRDTGAKQGESGSVPNLPNVSRGDLDAAIEAGDWAAVGATAALLAAASDSQDTHSHSSRSGRTSSSRGGSAVSSIDAARAAELDHLVDAGDWEGVVLAAAKFEASEEGSKSSSRSQKSGSAAESKSLGGSTGGASSGYSPSMSDSESPSKQQKRAEIRAEVEALVRRVVPEEIDNVDEMMLQFKGREEELVETLRTMQERAVAQKARVQGQKIAKREARNTVQQGGVELPVPGATAASAEGGEGLTAAAAAGVAAGTAAAIGVTAGIAAGAKKGEEGDSGTPSSVSEPELAKEDSSKASESISGTSSSSKRRTALELAIEAGDWEAVGEAAAMMSDTSVTTASSGEVRALAEGLSYDDEDSDIRRMRKAGVNADRAAELDAMIDKGDWTGVVAAAGRFSKIDSQTEESSDSSASESKQSDQQGKKRSWFGGSSLLDSKKQATEPDATMDVDIEKDADQARKEEEDALAQAEIWMAIANQSKQEGSTEDAGASDAADWAIARSLSALRSAEQRGELTQPSKDGSPPASSSASMGEADSKEDRSV